MQATEVAHCIHVKIRVTESHTWMQVQAHLAERFWEDDGKAKVQFLKTRPPHLVRKLLSLHLEAGNMSNAGHWDNHRHSSKISRNCIQGLPTSYSLHGKSRRWSGSPSGSHRTCGGLKVYEQNTGLYMFRDPTCSSRCAPTL